MTVRILALTLLLAACHRSAPVSFRASLRCGMTRDEVSALAKKTGYRGSPRPAPSNEVLDLTFRSGRLVALREGRYDPVTKTIAYREVALCGGTAATPPGSAGRTSSRSPSP